MRRNSTTTPAIPSTGKYSCYDRDAGCIAGYYNGNLTGYYRNEAEAHEALDDIAYAALTHPHTPVEEIVEDYRSELATSADRDAYVAEWDASAENERDQLLVYAMDWNNDAFRRTPAEVVLLPDELVIINALRAIEGAWARKVAA